MLADITVQLNTAQYSPFLRYHSPTQYIDNITWCFQPGGGVLGIYIGGGVPWHTKKGGS